MTRKTFKYSIIFLAALGLFGLLILAGCEGVSGPRGDNGPPGENGPDYQDPTPENRFFSLAVTNKSMAEHNGAPKLYLSFDGEHTAAGDTVVSVRLEDTDPVPAVDGVDGGSQEWAGPATTVKLYKAAGTFNFIEAATVRSAFDEEYVYFQVKWTEVANEQYGLEVGLSDRPAYLIYPQGGTGNAAVWDYEEGNEDRVLLLFEITPVTRYASDGCFVTCHTDDEAIERNYHATRAGGEWMDVWMWGAALTNPTGYLRDQYMTSSPSLNVLDDNGLPLLLSNMTLERDNLGVITRRQPTYQALGDPNLNSSYPLWPWQIVRVSTSGWVAGSQVPAFISNPNPSNSAGDVEAQGTFDADSGTWTVEMRRARRTGNGDDVQF